MHMASYGDDHVRERGDNRACNLRWATLSEAFSQRPRPKKNKRRTKSNPIYLENNGNASTIACASQTWDRC